MQPPATPLAALTSHFLRGFVASDTPAADADSATTMVRALATVATPALMAAFWLATLAPKTMLAWPAAGTHYLFVLYSFVALGAVATVQWESLFPEPKDFLILLPLPLPMRTLLTAKLRAVGLFLLAFLVAANVFGTVLMPALAEGQMLRALWAHAVATACAGAAAALLILAVESAVILVVPSSSFRRTAPLLKALLIASLLTLLFLYGTVAGELEGLFSGAPRLALCVPPLWYLAVYECALHSAAATPYAHMLARIGLVAIPVLAACTALLYPSAWGRRKRMALEGSRSRPNDRGAKRDTLLDRTLLRSPAQRAVFRFVQQTLLRIGRYSNHLALYAGVGLALSICLAIRLSVDTRGTHLAVWRPGVLAALPVLLFWTVAGLRSVFLLPVELSARWIFRMAPLRSSEAVRTTGQCVLLCCAGVIALCAISVGLLDGSLRTALLHGVFGVGQALLLTDAFFFLHSSIPFTRPRLPGRQSLPGTLAVYVFGLPLVAVLSVIAEMRFARLPWTFVLVTGAAALLHMGLERFRRSSLHPALDDAYLDEADDEFLTLSLTT